MFAYARRQPTRRCPTLAAKAGRLKEKRRQVVRLLGNSLSAARTATMRRWLPFLLLTLLAPGLWAGVNATAPSASGYENRNGSLDPIGYLDGWSLYCAYFVPGTTDPSGYITTDQVIKVLNIIGACKTTEPDCGGNMAAGETFIMGWLMKQAGKPGIKYEDILESASGGIESVAKKVKSGDKALKNLAVLADLEEAFGMIPAHTGIQGDIEEFRERIKTVSDKLETTQKGLGVTIGAIVIARGMQGDSSAVDQVEALGAMLKLGGQFATIPGVSDMIKGYGEAVSSMSKNLEKIGKNTFEKDITIFSGRPCSLLKDYVSPSPQGFWDGLHTALNTP